MSVRDHNSELAQLVSELTTSGQKKLDESIMKKIKNICRKGDSYIEHVYHLLMSQLEKDHSEVRYSTLLIVDELFGRSHKFRELLLSDFQDFLDLTAETDPDISLPPPKNAAKDLKIKTLQLVQKWYDRYKDGYKRLVLGYNFLKDCKQVDFNDMEARSVAERRREEMLRKHQEQVMDKKLELAKKELFELLPEIKDVVEQMRNCFALLVPNPDELFPETELNFSAIPNAAEASNDEMFRQHGLIDRKHGIQIEIPSTAKTKVELNEDTQAIIENLQDFWHQVSTKHLPALSKLLKIFTKVSSGDMVKKTLDTKKELEIELEKFKELKVPTKGSIKSATDSNDDDDFEEVKEKEGYEETVLSSAVPVVESQQRADSSHQSNAITSKQWKINSHSKEESKDPTTLVANLQALARKMENDNSNRDFSSSPSTSSNSNDVDENSRKARLLTKAPRRPYDIDLYHWEEKKLEAPSVVKFDSLHKFWQPTDNSLVESQCEEGVASLRRRVIEYSGEFVPVKWTCRVPLPSGKLCPRRDRQKCPFHGPIVGRDSIGFPTDPEDAKRLKLAQPSTSIANSTPDWQDPTLLKEIEAATGIDLKMPTKGKGKKKKKKSDLTDIKKIHNTTRRRLEKKVFKKSSVQRVAQMLDAADAKLINDKFGNQWNYAFNT